MNDSQDRKQVLGDLISLYTEQLEKPVATLFGDLIQEIRKECIQELNLIKQADMEGMLLAKSRSTKARFSL